LLKTVSLQKQKSIYKRSPEKSIRIPIRLLPLVFALKEGHRARADELYGEALRLCTTPGDKARIRQKWNLEIGKALLSESPQKALRLLSKAREETAGEDGVAAQAAGTNEINPVGKLVAALGMSRTARRSSAVLLVAHCSSRQASQNSS